MSIFSASLKLSVVILAVLALAFTSSVSALAPTEPLPVAALGGQAQLSTPPDPSSTFPWTLANSGSDWYDATTLAQVQDAFNAARTNENNDAVSAPYEPMPMMNLVGTYDLTAWNALSLSEQALWLLNNERVARDLPPLDAVNTDLVGVAQDYAQYLLDNDLWGHFANGTPVQRINANLNLRFCFSRVGEALDHQDAPAALPNYSFPTAKSLYDWIYDDATSLWVYRQVALYDPYDDDTGVAGSEGLLGFGAVQGADWSGIGPNVPYVYIQALEVYDPLNVCGGLVTSSPPTFADYSDLAAYAAAWHTGSGLYLGVSKSLETGVPSVETYDDGITLVSDTNWGDGSAAVNASVTGGNACLSAWMDKGDDGSFDAGDLIIDRAQVAAGANVVPVDLGGFTFPNTNSSYAYRFRLTPRDIGGDCTSVVSPTGAASGGEVEDHRIAFGPLAVTLASFAAEAQPGSVVLFWETVSEEGNAGFNIYRSAAASGPWQKLNEQIIPSVAPGWGGGARYAWKDASAGSNGLWWYRLGAIDNSGSEEMVGVASIELDAKVNPPLFLPRYIR